MKRYEPSVIYPNNAHFGPGMDEEENGDYVEHSEVQKMLDEIADACCKSDPDTIFDLVMNLIKNAGFEVNND